MNKIILSGILLCMTSSAFSRPSQTIPSMDEQVSQFYDIQQTDMTYGDRALRIYSAVPYNVTAQRPILYMLDGNGLYPKAVNRAVEKLPADKLPIIIGIGYPIDEAFPKAWRTYDYTPPVAGDEFKQGGGSPALYQFLTDTIRPWAEKQFPIDKSKQTLFGHSFGGLFTLMAYQQQPDDFQFYVSASPSLWWGKGSMVDLAKLTAKQAASPLFVTLGGLEESPDLSKLSAEQVQNYQARKSWISTRQVCTEIANHQRHCEFRLFDGKNHGSVIPDAIDKALDVASQ
ncbi:MULTISPECIES: alpha/beta hydrolase [Providencia]|uniref:Alpha/beta hydrolase-fold protein n=1 Tax=Providencia rettgeri TaxID=587 RepID=A0AB35LE96_PRORE|nr:MULTISPECIES: alpha/beta hydrolase-fold protein [Providencia]AWS49755.1 alpha/beta hydrolase [Providencia rettgeri]EHZ7765935.1 alpha/beta hydrolase [Providencia rettgeri]EIJ7169077.1 alpha/beta hydrolase [Providencia rettgeri]EJD6048024.1 alpha/beta hydrolase [Providencia rettgeri]EJD6476188.1 alpha/beta hydrolase [Providencia rettgeri]